MLRCLGETWGGSRRWRLGSGEEKHKWAKHRREEAFNKTLAAFPSHVLMETDGHLCFHCKEGTAQESSGLFMHTERIRPHMHCDVC